MWRNMKTIIHDNRNERNSVSRGMLFISIRIQMRRSIIHKILNVLLFDSPRNSITVKPFSFAAVSIMHFKLTQSPMASWASNDFSGPKNCSTKWGWLCLLSLGNCFLKTSRESKPLIWYWSPSFSSNLYFLRSRLISGKPKTIVSNKCDPIWVIHWNMLKENVYSSFLRHHIFASNAIVTQFVIYYG